MKDQAKLSTQFAVSLAGLLAASNASAHHAMGGRTPETLFEGLLSGIAHPVIGLDHLAFLVVVGLLTFGLRTPGRWIVPGAFAAATVLGTLVHLGAVDLPIAEAAIAVSLLTGGLLVLARAELSTLALSLAVAGFGLFHGYAYGESIVGAEQTPLLAYLAGFALVQYALIAGVVGGVSLIARKSARAPLLLGRGGGALATLAGGVSLAMNLA